MSKLLVTEIEAFAGSTIGIGATVSQASSILTFTSTTQGIVLPRMTTTQRNAITSPIQGLIIYNTTTNQIERYDGSVWHSGVDLASSDVSGILPVANGGTGDSSLTANNVLIGNGTSPITFVAPGSNGNILLSNGTTWTSNTINLLSATTSDTLAASVVRGDVIIGNSTPKWARLAVGGSSTLFQSNGTDPSWGTVNLLSAFHGDTLAGSVTRGDLIVGNSTPKWARFAVGGTNTLITSNGTDPAWGTITLLSGYISDTVTASPTRGDLIVSNSTPKWARFAIGGASTLLTTNGTDPAWSTINLLSAFHADTTPASPVRGDLMIAGSTPTWTKLAIGSTARVLRSNGTDPSWAQVVLTTDVSGTLPFGNLSTNIPLRTVGVSLDGGGQALVTGQKGYVTCPFAGTITAWSITADTGTCTFDVWKIATGTAVPTVTNTIMGTKPALSTGTAIRSTTRTAWTTSVSANDIFGFNLDAVSSATKINFELEITLS